MKKILATFTILLLPLYFSAQETNISGTVKSEEGTVVSNDQFFRCNCRLHHLQRRCCKMEKTDQFFPTESFNDFI